MFTWTPSANKDPVQALTLIFNTEPSQTHTQKFSLMNCGSTLLRYDWEVSIFPTPFCQAHLEIISRITVVDVLSFLYVARCKDLIFPSLANVEMYFFFFV